MSVVLIEDEVQVRQALLRLLKAWGINAHGYASAQDFLLKHSAHSDCLIVDLQMPDLSGVELMEWMQGLGRNVPTIVITAHDEPLMRERCLAAGARAYLHKPIDEQTLLDAIAQAR